MSIIRKATRSVDRALTKASTCPDCGHSSASGGCRCSRSDCACGTTANR